MPSTVIASSRVQLQTEVIVEYLNERNPAAGRHFLERLQSAYRQLSEFPLIGVRGRAGNTRRLVMASYVITYRIDGPSLLTIIDIRHGRQREVPQAGDPA
jgi:plasmid stabilization system protein ParE